jgi:predicted transcriptional regulator
MNMSVSVPNAMRERLVAEAEATGLKLSVIIQQALSARWEAQDKAA